MVCLVYVSVFAVSAVLSDVYCSPCRVWLGYTLHIRAREVAHAARHQHNLGCRCSGR